MKSSDTAKLLLRQAKQQRLQQQPKQQRPPPPKEQELHVRIPPPPADKKGRHATVPSRVATSSLRAERSAPGAAVAVKRSVGPIDGVPEPKRQKQASPTRVLMQEVVHRGSQPTPMDFFDPPEDDPPTPDQQRGAAPSDSDAALPLAEPAPDADPEDVFDDMQRQHEEEEKALHAHFQQRLLSLKQKQLGAAALHGRHPASHSQVDPKKAAAAVEKMDVEEDFESEEAEDEEWAWRARKI